jgi:hypothetical protein
VACKKGETYLLYIWSQMMAKSGQNMEE